MLCRLKKDSISSEDAPKWSSSATSRLTSPDFPVSTIQGTPGRSLGHGGSKACMASAYAGGDVAKQASSRGMPIVFFIVASLGRCVGSLTGARIVRQPKRVKGDDAYLFSLSGSPTCHPRPSERRQIGRAHV